MRLGMRILGTLAFISAQIQLRVDFFGEVNLRGDAICRKFVGSRPDSPTPPSPIFPDLEEKGTGLGRAGELQCYIRRHGVHQINKCKYV